MIDDLLPDFAFKQARHDRLCARRGDAGFLEAAWADPTTRVVVVRDLELAVTSDGRSLATVSPEDAPPGQRMLLGRADGVVYFLVLEDPTPAGDEEAPTYDGRDFRALRTVATSLDPVLASLAVHAVALAQWHDRHPQWSQ